MTFKKIPNSYVNSYDTYTYLELAGKITHTITQINKCLIKKMSHAQFEIYCWNVVSNLNLLLIKHK